MKKKTVEVTICAPLGRHWLHGELTQCTEYQEGILDEEIVSRKLVWWSILQGVSLAFLRILSITV